MVISIIGDDDDDGADDDDDDDDHDHDHDDEDEEEEEEEQLCNTSLFRCNSKIGFHCSIFGWRIALRYYTA